MNTESEMFGKNWNHLPWLIPMSLPTFVGISLNAYLLDTTEYFIASVAMAIVPLIWWGVWVSATYDYEQAHPEVKS